MWSPDIHWPSFVMGWPAIGVSLGLFTLAFVSRRWWVAAVAAVVAVPFCFYLTAAWPLFGVAGPGVLVANFAAVIELRRRRFRRAALLVLPFVCVTGLLGFFVWWQEHRRMQATWERHFGGR